MPNQAQFKKQSGGYVPREWFRKLGFPDHWIDKHAGVGPFDYAPRGDAGWLFLANQRFGHNHSSFTEMLDYFEAKAMFAGRQQWVIVTDNKTVPVAFRNVSSQSIVTEPQAQRLFLNRLLYGYDHEAHEKAWDKATPDWAETVKAELEADGVPFSVELLADGDINLKAGKPLFAKGRMPQTLLGLKVLQEGERGYLESLDAPTLMREVWPLYWERFHTDNDPEDELIHIRMLPSYIAYRNSPAGKAAGL
jgi:hypothetical protein